MLPKEHARSWADLRVLAILDRRTGKQALQRIIQQDAWNGWPE